MVCKVQVAVGNSLVVLLVRRVSVVVVHGTSVCCTGTLLDTTLTETPNANRTLPYIEGTSETIARILQPYNIRVLKVMPSFCMLQVLFYQLQ